MTSLPAAVDRHRAGAWLVAVAVVGATVAVTWRFVGTLALGLFVYYVARPVLRRVQPRLPNRTLAVVVSVVVLLLPTVLLSVWLVVVGVLQASAFLDTPAGGRLVRAVEPYADLAAAEATLRDSLSLGPAAALDPGAGAAVSAGIDLLVGAAGTTIAVSLHVLVVAVVAFYLLRDDYRVAAWARTTVAPDGSAVRAYLLAVDRDLQTVFFGNVLTAVATGVVGAVVYAAANAVAPPGLEIPQPVALGLLTGIASLIPIVGMKLVWIPLTAVLAGVALATDPGGLWFAGVFALVSFVVVDYLPDQFLRPYVSGRSLHVGLVMLAYVLGPLLFGWAGVVLGPLLLVVALEFVRVVLPWLLDPDGWTPPSRVAAATGTRSRSRTRRRSRESPARAGPAAPTRHASDGGSTPLPLVRRRRSGPRTRGPVRRRAHGGYDRR